MASVPVIHESFEQFLEADLGKELLRFTTAGSVDDGKSTLIGRLLYDAKGVYEDQFASVKKSRVNRSSGPIDFSLLTDGLRAEREQGITIDVAYRYFATARRKFIIADTPGHEQYTRNMATGASTADLAVILIDARNGVLQQSRRHGFIASLLGIPNFVIAVNKMDAVGYDEAVFRAIETEYREFVGRLGASQNSTHVYFLPISALEGDNVVRPSRNMPWFQGPCLLEFLESVPVHHRARATAFRFPVQRVIRPDQDFRGYAGQIVSGAVRPGDGILALPSGRRSRVKSVETFDGQLEEAIAPMSVTLTLEDEVDISRGDMLVSAQKPPDAARQFDASVVWMSEQPLDLSRPYVLKHTTQTLAAGVKAVKHRVNIKTLEHEPADSLEMNGIGVLRIETSRPIYFDAYAQNRATGSVIIIDPETNATVGAGMILAPVIVERDRSKVAALDLRHERVTPVERIARYRHGGQTVSLGDRKPLAWLLERKLFDRGCVVTVIEHASPQTLEAMEQAGLLVLLVSSKAADWDLPRDDSEAADRVIASLEETEILLRNESLTGGEGI